MIVEIDLFSGRPNPRWQVDEGVRREVLEIEARLKVAQGRAIELPGLGYRGFVFEDGSVKRRAFDDLVEREGVILASANGEIERLLLMSMPTELAGVRERVAKLLR